MPQSALFLDRDGVINVDHGYVFQIEKFQFIPGIFDLTRFAADVLRWPIIVVTNQSGIGRGLFDETAYEALTDWMLDRFAAEGSPLMRVYHSPHHPIHGIGPYRQDHPWRKPRPGMFLQAAADYDLDLKSSVAIGDSLRDMQAGAAAGVRHLIRVDANEPRDGQTTPAYHVARNPAGALSFLRAWFEGPYG
jgi:D-glycero-D-manno-heptose 1,7-bisphosphate phosphatase